MNGFIDKIFSPSTIRIQAQKIYDLTRAGKTHFQLDEDKITSIANYVLETMKATYPTFDVPYHSRWRHFDVKCSHLLGAYNAKVSELAARERARIGLDLIIPSVLIDAGAGANWAFTIAGTDLKVGRSEGLALASLEMFLAGELSGNGHALISDAEGLFSLSHETLIKRFQVTDTNPLLAIDGRILLLNKLGEVLAKNPVFPNGRLGDFIDLWFPNENTSVSALTIMQSIIDHIGTIWPGRLSYAGRNLGDTWIYQPLGEGERAYVPFHKLSQWLTYSIIETLENADFNIRDIDKLTGLAEYRNGGLFVDGGILALKKGYLYENIHAPSSNLIIEWRALTIVLLDEIGRRIQATLNKSPAEFPLAKVLEGGTWSAGRKLAAHLRADNSPPINILSDGTVF